ncbi:MAG: exopolysaccharide biosynthesis protein [Synechococcaceae cyanobacterium RL_1_2]|nr:exopolysaccharide biosynthesis protein [Synechococcaceae cyanobacterium RL_1_2]
MSKLSVELEQYFFEELTTESVQLQQIVELAGERLFGLLLVLLSLPSALPIPAPGYSTPFGVVIFLLASQLIIGRTKPWIPDKMLHKSWPTSQVQSVIKAGLPWLKRLETITKPRYTYVCTSRAGRTLLGIAMSLMAISMMIPIPGTNTLPAIGVFVTAFGLQEDDGLISLGGLGICVAGLSLTTLILIFGQEVVKQIIDWIRAFQF